MSDPVKFEFGPGFLGPVVISEKLRYLFAPELFGFSEYERVLSTHVLVRKFFFLIFSLLSRNENEEFFSRYFADEIKTKNIIRLNFLSLQKIIVCNIKCEKRSEISSDELIRFGDCNSRFADFIHFLKIGENAISPHRRDYGYILEVILDRWWNLGLHSPRMKSYVDHNKLYFINNCRRFCCILLAIRKRRTTTTILHRLPKDIVLYLAKILWQTKFEVLTWI